MRIISLIFLLVSCGKDIELIPSFNKNSAFIINGGDNSISVLDLNKLTISEPIYIDNQGESFSHHIYISKDKTILSVANSGYDFSNGHTGIHAYNGKGKALLLNTSDAKITKEIEIPFSSNNVIITEDNKEIWTATHSHSGKVLVYDSKSGVLLNEIPVGADPSEIIFAKEGSLALVASSESSFLTVIHKSEKKVIKEIKVDPLPSNVWPGFDENSVFIENSNQKSLNIVDLNKLLVIDFIDFPFVPGHIVFNKLKNEIWVCAKSLNQIAIYTQNKGVWELKNKINTEEDPHHISFFNNFKTAIVANQKANSIQIIDCTSFNITKKFFTSKKPNGIAIWE